ncbi:MAG: hypothetical protein FJY98_00280 [Candidatus Liptonbacteria bacterium]|nr:hypothetical protein [Candidatus Liptonbacteria bacterium]
MTEPNFKNIAIGVFLATVVMLGGGIILVNTYAPGEEIAQKSEEVEKIIHITHPIVNGGPKLEIGLSAPIQWRTTISPSDKIVFDTFNDTLAIFSFVPYPRNPVEKGADYKPENYLEFYNVTEALDSPKYELSITRAEFEGLMELRKTKIVTDPDSAYVESADGVLSGIAKLSSGSTQSPCYWPNIWVEMAGVVEGKHIYVTGRFQIYDQLLSDLMDQSKECEPNARNLWPQGGTEDAQMVFDMIVRHLRSLSVTPVPFTAIQ